jgi:alkanesulfonate monooxygenase SsuD/methylene tetrahydromethanopterin reductase-like flavin-dependent oxidoreductase (luciferase family)
MLEAYTLLGALAAATEAVRLGALVTAVMLRNPAFLAKTVTTLDIISGGRAILGIGAGWDGAEYASYGIDFPPVKDREDRLEEAVQICRQMMGGKQPNTYDGQHYELKEAWNSPLPIQPHVPILIGGGGEKRTLAAVARYADACNIGGEIPVIAHKLGVLKAHCDEIGRDFSEISKTSGMAPSEDLDELCRTVEERFEIGIEGVVLSGVGCPSPLTVEAWGTALHKAFGAR